MSRIGDLLIEAEAAGYDMDGITTKEALEIREFGRILDSSRDWIMKIENQAERWRQENEYLDLCRKVGSTFIRA